MSNSEKEQYPNLLIAIGASAGGLKEVMRVLDEAPENISATFLVAIHRQPAEENVLAGILSHNTRVKVLEAVDGDRMTCARIYVGKGQETIEVEGSHLEMGIDVNEYRKLERINDLFKSVAEAAGENSVGVILSGMLWDGVDGLEAIQKAGGCCLIQDPRDADFDSMPQHALDRVKPDFVGTAREIGQRIVRIAAGRKCQ